MTSLLKLKKRLAENDKAIEEKKILLTNEGIQIIAVSGNDLLTYRSIQKMGITPDFIYFITFSNMLSIIPTRSFSGYSEVANFYGVMQEEWAKSKSGDNYANSIFKNLQTGSGHYDNTGNNFKNPKRLYYLGWFGFIPVAGAVMGIILIIRGIFEYKDKILVLIGLLCILPTSVFYYYNYKIEHSDSVKKMYITMNTNTAVSQLNGLVKSIEFYKLQNDAYPDSLQQILKDSKSTIIYDPLIKNATNRKTCMYHYRKIGDKYTVFSVGLDGIAGTADDIYPTTAMNDTAKFGLIKAR